MGVAPGESKRTSLGGIGLWLTGLTLWVCAAGCGGSAGSATSVVGGATGGGRGALKVVVTTTQIADFARNLGGDRVQVAQILRPNVDPHDYEPSPADVAVMTDANLVIRNGVGLDDWLEASVSSAGFSGTVVEASVGVPIRHGTGSEERAGDPHVWHNPRYAGIMVGTIEKAFTAADPAGTSTYRANLAAYDRSLDALDADIQRKIDTVPPDQRKLVTNHDAFGYYVQRYGLQFVGSVIPSFSTSAELSGRQIQDLVAKIKATGTRAVFSESSLPPKTAETIGGEAGVKVEAGQDALYGDTLGPPGSAGATYLSMERHNTDTIVTALGGSGG